MSALRVGLTGGLASGKSTAAALLAERGARVIDADELVADLYRPGGEGAAAVHALFGEAALAPDGSVDRAAVARRVFADAEARRALEAAIHPLVRRRFEALAEASGDPVVVLEATLLVEAGYGAGFDLIVTVEADPAVRLRRAVARGMDAAEARARLAAQGEGEARRAAAHRVLRNDGDLAALTAQIDELVAELGQMAALRQEGAG
ncbi:MAG TPA: dephospho-CoA kinase [Thermoanaerobaculia bacterium]|nr:dephospho-CoA kinase [Thermoanaerobaculia bacterium]